MHPSDPPPMPPRPAAMPWTLLLGGLTCAAVAFLCGGGVVGVGSAVVAGRRAEVAMLAEARAAQAEADAPIAAVRPPADAGPADLWWSLDAALEVAAADRREAAAARDEAARVGYLVADLERKLRGAEAEVAALRRRVDQAEHEKKLAKFTDDTPKGPAKLVAAVRDGRIDPVVVGDTVGGRVVFKLAAVKPAPAVGFELLPVPTRPRATLYVRSGVERFPYVIVDVTGGVAKFTTVPNALAARPQLALDAAAALEAYALTIEPVGGGTAVAITFERKP